MEFALMWDPELLVLYFFLLDFILFYFNFLFLIQFQLVSKMCLRISV